MRALVCLLALFAAGASARADESRAVPAVGSKLTYRFVTQTISAGRTTASGMIYTYIVTAGDASSAEGIIKPLALIVHCNNGAADPACRDVPGARIEGDLLTQPVGADAGDSLSRQSWFKLVYFLPAERKLPVPGPRDPKAPLGEIGPEPDFVLTNTLDCDLAALASFLPVGSSPHVALSCQTVAGHSASRAGRLGAQTAEDTITYDITYTGSGWVTLPSGNWEVKKLAFKLTPKDPKHPAAEGESLFSPQLGALVRTHTVGMNPAARSTTENTSELIAVAP